MKADLIIKLKDRGQIRFRQYDGGSIRFRHEYPEDPGLNSGIEYLHMSLFPEKEKAPMLQKMLSPRWWVTPARLKKIVQWAEFTTEH